MTSPAAPAPDWAARNIRLYRIHRFLGGVVLWQAIWFLFVQNVRSPAEAILIYAVYDVASLLLEVPSGYMSDRLGRQRTLMAAAVALALGAGLQAFGVSFATLAVGAALTGASFAFVSGTDSALLYESLKAAGQGSRVASEEMIGWRLSFVALALSALAGGVLALWSLRAPYAAMVPVALALLVCARAMHEPPHLREAAPMAARPALAVALRRPLLMWLLLFSSAMYLFSHVPFVFGQPFIAGALGARTDVAPLVSAAVTAVMMGVSVAASFWAPRVAGRAGLLGLLLLALAMQVGLIGGLVAGIATGFAPLAAGLLLVRMVPDAFSDPFIRARLQPELPDAIRATYLSLQSVAGRLALSASLIACTWLATDPERMTPRTLMVVLAAYAGLGVAIWGGLALTGRRAGVAALPPGGGL